jgi:hypothetical protein
MAYFDDKRGVVGKPEYWEKSYLGKNLFTFLTGQQPIQQPKQRKTNILSK